MNQIFNSKLSFSVNFFEREAPRSCATATYLLPGEFLKQGTEVNRK